MRKLTKALTVVSLLAPVSGHSLGIGDIRVRSALNQNLNAEIALVSTRGEDPANIKVSLAPAEKFDEAGVPWTYFLSKIRFTPVVKPNGSMVIKVTSREALKEPYLNFLLEVSWPKGNLYREFTVLVDPPAEYQHQEYQEPQYQEPAYPTSATYDTYRAPKQDYVPRRAIRHRVAKPRRNPAGSYGGQIVTRRNDTLWNVAERARDAGVSVEQMMIALYQKNPQAFYKQNVNALSAGERLQVPEKSIVQQTSRQEALAEFSQHNEAWNNNRGSVAAREPQSDKEAATVDTQLKLEAPTEATVAVNENVSPSSEQTTGTKNATPTLPPSTNPDAKQEVITKEPAPINDAVQSKIAALEKQMAMMQELIALKDKQLADLQNPGQVTPIPTPPTQPLQQTPQPPIPAPTGQVAPPPVSPQPAVPPVSQQEKPAQTVVAPKPIINQTPVVKKVEQPVAVDEPISPLLWVVGALGVVLVPLFGWIWWQKKKVVKEFEAESIFRNYSSMQKNDAAGSFSSVRKSTAAPSEFATGESSFLNDFKASDFESFESFNVDHGDIDPLAEADVYLAYGRYQQAEDLIKQAIKDFPERDDCKLKLLEIYHASSSKDDFENYAVELIAEGKNQNKEFWPKVVLLSQDICPDSDIFSYVFEDKTAVFSVEPETQIESILQSKVDEPVEAAKPSVDSEHLGAANFEVSDDDQGESFFDATPPPTESAIKSDDESVVLSSHPEISYTEPDLVVGSMDSDDYVEQQNNESLEFDLGSYSAMTKKPKDENDDDIEEYSFDNATDLSTLNELDDNNDLESYDFDLKLDEVEDQKTVEIKGIQTEIIKELDEVDSNQPLEFSFDTEESSGKDIFGKDILDFSFDLDPKAMDFEKTNDSNQSFRVSDLTDMDEMETKLDLAKAYIDMGDSVAAKEIIQQVMDKGSAEQKSIAKLLLDDLS